ncbi:hypothetical protein MMC13_006915 [Lambiella insularis]|nr:hypothetical protein [Lambiella insularis]
MAKRASQMGISIVRILDAANTPLLASLISLADVPGGAELLGHRYRTITSDPGDSGAGRG